MFKNIKVFLPLIAIFAFVTIASCILTWHQQGDYHLLMVNFMGFFFVVFGAFKISNLVAFAQAYRMYDLIAQRSVIYAYMYPFIEVALGIAYLVQWNIFAISLFTFFLMSISALGVAKELMRGSSITCACLGVVFKVPMTWVTFGEDLLMALMALWMLR